MNDLVLNDDGIDLKNPMLVRNSLASDKQVMSQLVKNISKDSIYANDLSNPQMRDVRETTLLILFRIH